jgi:hypothetical protein
VGGGANKAVVLSAGGQQATAAQTFSYALPTVSSYAGSPVRCWHAAADADRPRSINPRNGATSGTYTLTVSGNSFSTTGNVTVGGQARTHARPPAAISLAC